ncbi:MAG TPA: hypothetical protein VNA87_02065 [Actinomycetota bacterium]|nr:hypothetical protein [Actinomycetota bacterium]
MRWVLAVMVTLSLLFVTAPSQAAHMTAHGTPTGPATKAFAPDFVPPKDSEWGWDLGGFGGESKGKALAYNPVIFFHGMGYDSSFWEAADAGDSTRNVRSFFKSNGYADQEIWAVSYNGARCLNTLTCGTSNDVNVPDAYSFIQAVRAYTGAAKVDIVAHSLGVTVVRKTVRVHPDLLDQIEDMVLIAGANHGSTSCRGLDGTWYGCNELVPGSPWQADINTWDPRGDGDETQSPIRYMTIYDGTGNGDNFFLKNSVCPGDPTLCYDDTQSPVLTGADNRQLAGELHLPLARGKRSLDIYLPFVKGNNFVLRTDGGTVVTVNEKGVRVAATGPRFGTSGGLSMMLAGLILFRLRRRASSLRV